MVSFHTCSGRCSDIGSGAEEGTGRPFTLSATECFPVCPHDLTRRRLPVPSHSAPAAGARRPRVSREDASGQDLSAQGGLRGRQRQPCLVLCVTGDSFQAPWLPGSSAGGRGERAGDFSGVSLQSSLAETVSRPWFQPPTRFPPRPQLTAGGHSRPCRLVPPLGSNDAGPTSCCS